MKTLLLIASFIFFIASCHKDDDIGDPVRAKLEAHTWVFDSSYTGTYKPGSDEPVVTKIIGDSSRTLTYYDKTFVISDRQGTEKKKYRLEKFEIYYWNDGYHESSGEGKHIVGVNDSILVEQVIRNYASGYATNTFLNYHAK